MNVLSLFDGMSCGQISFDKLGIKFDGVNNIYFSAEIDKYAVQITKKNYPNTVFIGNVFDIDYSKLPKIDFVIGGSPCFVKDTKVYTLTGHKNIQDIVIGDYVLTHKNRFRKVVNIGNEVKNIYKLKAEGIIETLTTENHPYYIREMKRIFNKEKRAYERVLGEPKWKNVSEIKKDDYIGIPIISENNNEFNLTEEDCWLLGRYLADGHIRKDKRKNRKNSYQYQVIYSIGDKKIDYFKKNVKRNFSCYKHTKSTYRCVISSMDFLNLIELIGLGKGAINKKIPVSILNLEKKLLLYFLDGYLSGDGCENKDGSISATSISKDLIISLSIAIAKCYKVPSGITINYNKPTTVIEGRLVNQKKSYSITFKKERKNQSHFIVIDDIIWTPIKKIIQTDLFETVYNITVEEDESYTANNAIVHNCTHWSIAKKDRETTSSGIGFDLFMQYVKAIDVLKPKYFLYENNFSIHKNIKEAISEKLGVKEIMINSALVSAQQRKRCYWTNIQNIEQPLDKGLLLKDILESGITDKDKSYCLDAIYYKGTNIKTYIEKSKRQQIYNSICINEDKKVKVRKNSVEIDKLKELLKNSKLNVQKTNKKISKELQMPLTKVEHWFRNDLSFAIPSDDIWFKLKDCLNINTDYFDKQITEFVEKDNSYDMASRVYLEDGKGTTLLTSPFRIGQIGKGGQGQRIYSVKGKSICLTAISGGKAGRTGLYKIDIPDGDYIIRKLTPIECERLQTVPDNYTEGVSNTQRYKMLGNGWTVDIIKHILEKVVK